MLLGILRILERDPGAQIIILPSDHHVLDEKRFVGTIRIGADLVDRAAEASALRERMLLIGVAPEEADPELGYIVQGDSLGNGIRGVSQFVEKPSATGARTLIERGAVWNSFILVAHGTTALACIEKRYPNIVGDMIKALRLDATHGTSALQDLYQDIPVLDFSRSIAQGAESALCVKASPICGWTDLGTPQRVGRALHGLWTSPKRKAWFRGSHTPAFVDLATRYSQLSGAIGNPAPFAV
jgi:mannose-1-phosphate guanylyltransferase